MFFWVEASQYVTYLHVVSVRILRNWRYLLNVLLLFANSQINHPILINHKHHGLIVCSLKMIFCFCFSKPLFIHSWFVYIFLVFIYFISFKIKKYFLIQYLSPKICAWIIYLQQYLSYNFYLPTQAMVYC